MTGSLVAVIVCHVDHGAPVGEEGGDASEGAEVVDFEIIHADMDSEIFFEIHHQLHELQRVQKARLDQIRLRQRNVEVEPVAKELREPVEQERVGRHVRSPHWAVAGTWLRKSSFNWRRSIFPLAFLGSASKTLHCDGNM